MATNEPAEVEMNTQFDRVATQILDTFEPLIRQLIARRDALLKELQDLRDAYVTKESTRKAAREELLTTLQQLQGMKTNENRQFSLQTINIYEKHIKDLESTLPQPFLLYPTLNQLKTAITEFGEVKEWKLDYSLKKQPVLAVGKRGSANNELSSATGLALDEVNQLIYIVDRNNRRIQVLSFEGKFLKRIGQDVLKYPWGITVTEDNVFVTDVDLHALLQFRACGELVILTGREGAEEGELNVPRGLCLDCNGDVYVADSRNDRVSVFSPQLQFVKYLGTPELKYPQDVKVTQNRIVVLDWSPNCIHFYSMNGEFQSSCVSHGEGGMVSDPYFFCCDTANNILITDRERHEIKILSPSGHLICKIGKKGNGRGEFQFPYGICISMHGVIFVTSWNSNFSLQSF